MNYKSDYNSEPIWFCVECLAPTTKYNESEGIYECAHCGSTNHLKATLQDWENIFYSKYGTSYMELSKEEFAKMSELI